MKISRFTFAEALRVGDVAGVDVVTHDVGQLVGQARDAIGTEVQAIAQLPERSSSALKSDQYELAR